MKTLILQNVSTKEIRTVVQAVAIADKDEYKIIRTDISDLESYSEELKTATPIGSVEFVRKAMEVAGIKEPKINPYPITDEKYLHRKVKKRAVEKSFYRCFIGFVKPTILKEFSGFVYDSSNKNVTDDYINEQRLQLFKSDLESMKKYYVWTSDIVDFLAEWRYYIRNKKIVGYARYDDNEEEIQEPDISLIKEYISKLKIRHPYVLDFGILSTGETALVEYNDFWSLGLYENALSPKDYLEMLIERFNYIRRK